MFGKFNLLRIILILAIPLFSTQILAQTAAETPLEAEDFIRELATNALDVLNDTTLTKQERDESFRNLLKGAFDLDYIGRLVLGRFGRKATKTEMQEFKIIFPEYVLKIYAGRLNEFGDEVLEIGGTAPAGKKDIFVQSQVIRMGGKPVTADWRVRRVKEEFKIIDLKIEGISMVLTQRDEFSGKISKVGMQGLIKELKTQSGLK